MKRERKGEREAKQCRQIRFSFRAVDEGIIREQSNKKPYIYVSGYAFVLTTFVTLLTIRMSHWYYQMQWGFTLS